jgi:hypothetical protein
MTTPKKMVTLNKPCMNPLFEAIKTYGSIYDIPEDEACRLLWNFWDSGALVDDLFFFVSEQSSGQQEAPLQVCRHSFSVRPEINILVDWYATLALNFISHSKFALRVSVCSYAETKNSSVLNLVVDEEMSLSVFASPIEACKLERGGKSASFEDCLISFPQVYFSVNNFDSCFEHIRLHYDNVLIVELVAIGPESLAIQRTAQRGLFMKLASDAAQSVIFQGAVSYDSVLQAAAFKEFEGSVLMSGPDQLGEAQIRVNSRDQSKTIVKLKRFLRSVLSKEDTSQHARDFECQLTFIRMHWLDILSKLHR